MQDSTQGVPHDAFRREEELSLFDIMVALWRHRFMLKVWTGAFAVLVALAVLAALLLSPSRERMYLQFRLTFSGADEGQYPNGVPFSHSDIVASEVLDGSFEKSGISAFMDRRQFGDALTVMKSDEGLEFIEQMYEPLLSERSRFSSEERQRFRQEYNAAKSRLFAQADYSLYFTSAESKGIPKSVRAQALHNVLEQWARFSERRRGVHISPVALISQDVFEDIDAHAGEPLIQLDKLRLLVQRLESIATEISNLPGALVIQVLDVPGIETIRQRLSNLDRYQINPLFGMIRKGRLYNDLLVARTYVETHLYALGLEADREEGTLELVQEAMESYLRRDIRSEGTEPNGQQTERRAHGQFGDRFLDRLVALANQEGMDTQYRQGMSERRLAEGNALLSTQKSIALYEDLMPDDISDDSRMPVAPEERDRLKELFTAGYAEAVQMAKTLNAQIWEIEPVIRRRNLGASQRLYTIISPPLSIERHPSLPLKRIAVFSALAVFGFLALLIFLILIADRVRKNAEASNTKPGPTTDPSLA